MYASSNARAKVIELETQVLTGTALFYFTDMSRALDHIGISFEVEYKILKRQQSVKIFPLQEWTILHFRMYHIQDTKASV